MPEPSSTFILGRGRWQETVPKDLGLGFGFFNHLFCDLDARFASCQKGIKCLSHRLVVRVINSFAAEWAVRTSCPPLSTSLSRAQWKDQPCQYFASLLVFTLFLVGWNQRLRVVCKSVSLNDDTSGPKCRSCQSLSLLKSRFL